VEEVRGSGVVGEQPELEPGEGFRYTSGTSLHTPTGMMSGEFEMQTDEGCFWVDVPMFSLDSPIQLSRPN
jgi:ApaG protein